MRLDAWLPVYIGFGLYFPVFLFIFFLPKGLGVTAPENSQSWGAQIPVTTAQDEPLIDSEPNDASTIHGPKVKQFRELLMHSVGGLSEAWASFIFFFRKMPIAPLLFTRLTTTLGKSAQEMLLQFARRRFGWSWSQVSRLHPNQAQASFVIPKQAICLVDDTDRGVPLTDGIPNLPKSRPHPATAGSNPPRHGLHPYENLLVPLTHEGPPHCAGQLSIIASG